MAIASDQFFLTEDMYTHLVRQPLEFTVGRAHPCFSPREPQILAWSPRILHTKIFRVKRARLKIDETLPTLCIFYTYRVIRCSCTRCGKVFIAPALANIWNPDFFASVVVNTVFFLVLFLFIWLKFAKKKKFRPNFLYRLSPVRANPGSTCSAKLASVRGYLFTVCRLCWTRGLRNSIKGASWVWVLLSSYKYNLWARHSSNIGLPEGFGKWLLIMNVLFLSYIKDTQFHPTLIINPCWD